VIDGHAKTIQYAVLEASGDNARVAPLLADFKLRLFPYHIANEPEWLINKPRKLPKSVTIE
jgi:glucosamine 6-phosphate synthetase-like amidotransferase/phosphosugar isomerase protein